MHICMYIYMHINTVSQIYHQFYMLDMESDWCVHQFPGHWSYCAGCPGERLRSDGRADGGAENRRCGRRGMVTVKWMAISQSIFG